MFKQLHLTVIVVVILVLFGRSSGFNRTLSAQAPPLYGDRWANSAWHSAWPFQFRWVTEGPGIYSHCTIQVRSADSGNHVSDFDVSFTNGVAGNVQSGSVEDLAVGPRTFSQITGIGSLAGYGCNQVIALVPLNVRETE
jgi:hypothetical protein